MQILTLDNKCYKLTQLPDRKKMDLTSNDIELPTSVGANPMRLESLSDTDERVFVAAVSKLK